MAYYETVLIARQDLSEGQVKDLTKELEKILKDQGAKILKTEYWGLRTLAYKINKSKKGHYVLIESDAPGAAVIELERRMRINEDVMRYLTVRLEKPTEGPSVVMGGGRKSRGENTENEKEAA